MMLSKQRDGQHPLRPSAADNAALLLLQQHGPLLKVFGNGEELAGNAWRRRGLGKLAEHFRMLPQVLYLGYYRAIWQRLMFWHRRTLNRSNARTHASTGRSSSPALRQALPSLARFRPL